MAIQVRVESGTLYYFTTIGEAVKFISMTPDAIKLSFGVGGERVRLIRVAMPNPNGWGLMFEPVAAHLKNADGSAITDPGEFNPEWATVK